MKRILSFFLCLVCVLVYSPAQSLESSDQSVQDRNAVFAREEFRRGVQAYNRYAFNEAIYSFERALSFRPQESLILDWLGKAYYRSGLEDTALRQWQSALNLLSPLSNEALLLNSRIETIRNRRALLPELDPDTRYVEAGRYPGKNGDIRIYGQPSGLLPLDDGSVWVVAYGTNEIVRIDVNGVVRQRLRGPLSGFDRPYDIARGLDGRLYVSEYRGGRISVLNERGEWLFYIGSKGYGDGLFVAPQYICIDDQSYLYVSDYGTRKISKFDPEGKFLLSFGERRGNFPGLRSPTGIAEKDGIVYVADSQKIYRFDRSGNYLGILIGDGLRGPESLRFTRDGRLLLADTNRILLIETDSMLTRELGSISAGPVRIVCADTDSNGNILAANFQAGEVSVMSRMNDLAAGLFVQIERVVTDRFPEVILEIEVQDRRRRPLMGLDARNFLITENGIPVAQQQFLGAGHLNNQSSVSILVERSSSTAGRDQDLLNAVRDTISSTDRLTSLISAARQPIRERTDTSQNIARSAQADPSQYSKEWKFDLGLRLAASDLLETEKKRAVVFIGSGSLGPLAFEQYGLSELAAYLANNNVRFYTVSINEGVVAPELLFLSEQSGGSVLYLYEARGIGPELSKLRKASSGSYQFSYRSSLPTDFGRAYLPVETEVYMLERSGRDATGYFPPLE